VKDARVGAGAGGALLVVEAEEDAVLVRHGVLVSSAIDERKKTTQDKRTTRSGRVE
jgi:hypothetical protein